MGTDAANGATSGEEPVPVTYRSPVIFRARCKSQNFNLRYIFFDYRGLILNFPHVQVVYAMLGAAHAELFAILLLASCLALGR